jgi:hypothetical protein
MLLKSKKTTHPPMREAPGVRHPRGPEDIRMVLTSPGAFSLYAFTGHCICFVPGQLKYKTVRLHARRLASAAPCKRIPTDNIDQIDQFNRVNGTCSLSILF